MGLLDVLKKMQKVSMDLKILILGLDNAGKTTLLRNLSQEEVSNTEPTKGFNVKTLVHENFNLNIWDLGGQQEIRKFWTYYYEDCHGIVSLI
jgi:small GTP-binding protein